MLVSPTALEDRNIFYIVTVIDTVSGNSSRNTTHGSCGKHWWFCIADVNGLEISESQKSIKTALNPQSSIISQHTDSPDLYLHIISVSCNPFYKRKQP
jgi:hypothetical protein